MELWLARISSIQWRDFLRPDQLLETFLQLEEKCAKKPPGHLMRRDPALRGLVDEHYERNSLSSCEIREAAILKGILSRFAHNM